MNRMKILIGLMVVFGLTASAVAGERPEKPNVLLILSDDLTTALSGYGHPNCKTPHLDRLAAAGVKFDRMYCQFPVCGASRSSLMNGVYPYTTGDLQNQTKFREKNPDAVTMSQLFMDEGYYVARVSKIYHMGIPGEIVAGTADHDDPASWQEAYNIQCDEQFLPGKWIDHSPGWGKGSEENRPTNQTFQRVEAEGGDLEMADGLAATKAIELMKAHKDEPFFLGVGFVRPHVPLVAPKEYFQDYPEEEMKLAKVPANDLDDLGEPTLKYKTTESLEIKEEDIPGLLAAYYATVTHMDAQVGRLLDALEEFGLDEKTVVIFSSDHGYHLGEHHKWQKQHMFEQTCRVPFLLRVPWLESGHGGTAKQITELVDLYPTVAEVCGVEGPDYLQGMSMAGILKDPGTKDWEKKTALTVSTRGGVTYRTEKFRYTEWNGGKNGVELYDLAKDPGEFESVADEEAYAKIRARLKRELKERKIAAGWEG